MNIGAKFADEIENNSPKIRKLIPKDPPLLFRH